MRQAGSHRRLQDFRAKFLPLFLNFDVNVRTDCRAINEKLSFRASEEILASEKNASHGRIISNYSKDDIREPGNVRNLISEFRAKFARYRCSALFVQIENRG